VIASATEFLSA